MSKKLSFLCIFHFFVVSIIEINAERFDGHKVFNFIIETEEHLLMLQNMHRNEKEVQFWKSPLKIGQDVNVGVSPEGMINFLKLTARKQFNSRLVMDDVQKVLDKERETVADTFSSKNSKATLTWDHYYRLDAIQNWLRQVSKDHSDVVKLHEIGKSYENRSILAMEISYNKNNPGIFIECHIHAREWITSATVTWIINELLNSKDPDVREIAESINWYIVPNINPDGFEYSHTENRMWRKTRSPQKGGCIGVDANRNFPFMWNEQGGASTNPCDETYGGKSSLSEVEIRALSDYYRDVRSKIEAFFSFHSYGQKILYPYGVSVDNPPANLRDLDLIGHLTALKLSKRYGTQYRVGNPINLLYNASGNSMDWAYATQGTPLAYTYEFRDLGNYGFLLPANQIIPNAQEVLDSIIAFYKIALRFGYFR